jgi:hypothetical protein
MTVYTGRAKRSGGLAIRDHYLWMINRRMRLRQLVPGSPKRRAFRRQGLVLAMS